MSGSISLESLEATLSSIFEIMMNEGTDTLFVTFGAVAGGAAAGVADPILPVGEIIGGIVGAITAFIAGHFISHKAAADALARAVLAHLNLEDIDGPCERA